MSRAFEAVRRSRRFTLLMGMIAILTVILVTRAQDAMAATLSPVFCDFYSDASYSTQVGTGVYNCRGQLVQRSGTITSYRICDYDYCCGNVWC